MKANVTTEPTVTIHSDRPNGLTVGQVLLSQADWAAHLRDETLHGLLQIPPQIPPVWFYDAKGSDLFSQITYLPEYYLSAVERDLLARYALEIAAASGAHTLLEIGAGSGEKTKALLTAMRAVGHLERYIPVDCSESALLAAANMVHESFPELPVHYVVSDFNAHLADLPTSPHRLIAFLGSTIGNLTPDERQRFLAEMSATMTDTDTFLVCTDLIKETPRLLAAYDDAAGVTAAFNRNALAVMNDELGADFDIAAYDHRAHWDVRNARIEMHMVARTPQRVRFAAFDDLTIELGAGDYVCTEYSHKFTLAMVLAELAEAGLEVTHQWQDDARDYLITLARRRR